MESPRIKSTMSFPEALTAVTAGERITKLEWDDPEIWGQLRDGILMLHQEKDGKIWWQWVIGDGDLVGRDWVVL